EELQRLGTTIADPLTNTSLSQIWQINQNTNRSDGNFVMAALVFNALNGNAGSSTITLGGYDYHGNARTTTDQRDQEAGQVIGRILASAAALNRPVFIAVTSDGSVGSVQSDSVSQFTTDRGSAGMLLGIFYDPQRSISLKKTQLGYFEQGQVASTSLDSVVGGSVERGVASIVLNYLALQNKVSDFQNTFRNMFNRNDLEKIILIDS
ncbi:MAG: hypothetical protein NZ480_04605, partial [Bdellovibrionaceae bacterium]|nr:hypothetical protein [Pseudobdellovibrionaceae bacterium]